MSGAGGVAAGLALAGDGTEVPPKRVGCSYHGCGDRRAASDEEYRPRGRQFFDAPAAHPGPWYCSLECAAYDGALTRQAAAGTGGGDGAATRLPAPGLRLLAA